MKLEEILKWVVTAGLFSILFVPLLVTNSLFFPFITGKAFAFRIIVEIVLVSWLLLSLKDTKYLPRSSSILFSFLAFILFIVFSNVFAIDPYLSFWSTFERMEGLIGLLHIGAFFLVIGSFFDKKLWNRFFITSLFVSLIVSFYGILQFSGVIQINQGGDRVDGTLGNAIYMAVYLLFHIFISIFYFFKAKNKYKYFFVAVALFEMAVLYLTASRGAILGLIGGLVLTSILILIFEKENKNLRRNFGIALIPLFVLIGGFLAIKETEFVKQSPVLSRFSEISISEIKTQGRYFIWPMAVEGFKARPVLGYGPEGFQFVFNEFYNPELYGQEPWFDRAHNIYLDWLIAGGILTLLSFVLIFYFVFRKLWSSSNFSTIEKSILTGLLSAYLFQGIFVFDNLTSQIMLFSVLAFVWSVSSKDSKNIFSDKVSILDNKFIPAVSVLAVLVLVVSLYFFNLKPLQANKNLLLAIHHQNTAESSLDSFVKVFESETFADVESLYQLFRRASFVFRDQNITKETKERYFILAKENIERLTVKHPRDVKLLLNVGSFYNGLNLPNEAILYLENAKELSPDRPEIYLEIGTAHFSLGETDKAIENFDYAASLQPQNPEGNIRSAIAYLHTKQLNLAEPYLENLGDKVYFQDRILNVFASLGMNDRVLEIWQKRVEAQPENLANLQSLVGSYILDGQFSKAIEILNKIVELDPSFKDNAEYAIDQIRSGNGRSLVNQ